MPYEVQKPSETEVSVTIRLSSAALRSARESKLRDYAERARVPGFRPGKVPRKILEKKLGASLDSEVRSALVEQEFRAAVEEHELFLLRSPQVEEKDFQSAEDGGVTVSVTLEVLPNFPLGDYKGLEVSVPAVTVGDEDVDRQIEDLRKRNVYSEEIEGPVEAGDFVETTPTYQFLDGTTYTPGEPIHVVTETGHVGTTQNDAAKDAFLGAKVGEQRKITLELDANFPEDEHRGKTAVVQCPISKILRARIPEIDEAFLQKFGVEDEAGLRAMVKDRMAEFAGRQREQMIEELCVERLLATHEFPLPKTFLDAMKDDERARIRADLGQRGANAEQIETHLLEIEGRLGEEVERRTRAEILLDRVADTEKVRVEQEELSRAVVGMAMNMGVEPQALFDRLVESRQVGSVVSGLRRTKARRLLREHAVTADEKGAGSAEGGGPPTEGPAPSAEQENS